MIKGNRASAYGSTLDAKGRRVEQEFRQCSHCQATWPYQPGSGRHVGVCSFCTGLLCTLCLQREWYKVDNRCVPFSEGMEATSRDYIYNPTVGIFVRK